MKLRRFCCFVGLWCVGWGGVVQGQEERGFVASLSPAERAAAGLDQLSEEQRAVLDALVASRSAPVAKATRAEVSAVSADDASVPRSARISRSRDRETESRVIESRLTGPFTGWTGRTIFELENGQRWVQIDDQQYRAHPPRQNPAVQVIPGMMGTYFLRVEGVGARCRVRLLED
jgi:hypothetical protein